MSDDKGISFREMFGDDAYYRDKFKDTKRPCPCCGAEMTMGTGERPSDYECPRCHNLFNSAGQRLITEAEQRRTDPFGDGYDYCGNDYDRE